MSGMESNTDEVRDRPEPADPNREAGRSEEDANNDPKVPPASETWVEGQPTSDADYGGENKL
jgi:hypothetical protein